MGFAADMRAAAQDFITATEGATILDYLTSIKVGQTYATIAAAHGVSQPCVSQFFQRHGYVENRRLSADDRDNIINLSSQGFTPAQIHAQHYPSVKYATVYQTVRRHRQHQ